MQARKTGRKVAKAPRHPSLPVSIEPALAGRRASCRRQSVGAAAEEPELSGSQNFGSSIERVELGGPLESFHESLAEVTGDREGPSRLRHGLG